MRNKIIIVDPMSTGRLYAKKFNAIGFDCIAVISRTDLPSHFIKDFNKDDYIETLFSSDEEIKKIGKRADIQAVVAGCETAIYLTDILSDLLNLRGNPSTTSDCRRDKFEMQKALNASDLNSIKSIIIKNLSEADKLLHDVDINKSYVIKPVNSAATDGVVFAQGKAEVHKALHNARWGAINDLGEINKGFIVQSFISGPEFVVDMVAHGEKYIVASVCRYKKINRNGSAFVYKELEVLDPRDESLKPLIDYSISCAKALDIHIGPIHMELIWSDKGPVMIEAGARLHGGIAPELFCHTYSPDLLSLAVQSYVNTNSDFAIDIVEKIAYGKIGFLVSDNQEIFHTPSEDKVMQLSKVDGYCGHKYFIENGSEKSITIDFATCPGLFWLAHDNEQKISHSSDVLRELLS